MPVANQKFRELYCAEADDQLAELSRTLLLLEKNPSDATLYESLMRSAHTLKGSSATMGYAGMAELAHALEDVFHAGERGVITIDPSAVTLSLRAVDMLTLSLANIKEGKEELSHGTLPAELQAFAKRGDGEPPKGVPALGALTHTDAEEEAREAAHILAPTQIRVNIDRLDALMGLFEELLMLRLKLESMLEPAVETINKIPDQELRQRLFFIDEYKLMFSEMARLLSEMQDELLSVRLVPLEQIFGQYPRMVRDLALREGKQVNFIVEGSEIELDRAVVGGLGGALAHLLRNAVDHGIEKEGTITLRALRDKGRARVIVEDTGSGVNFARVREVAISRGVGSAEVIGAMSERELLDILFSPNMSTNAEVTDISGRGIGLFAVRGFAEDVGGHVFAESPVTPEKRGTRFTLDLPISLATVKVLVVGVSGYTFAIPFSSVEKTVTVSSGSIMGAAHQETILIDEHLTPLLRLEDLLELTFGVPGKIREGNKELTLVILALAEGRVALLVDDVRGEKELLVKSLPPVLRGIKGFSGSTLLPDGRTILMLDASGLLQHAISDILVHTSL